MGGAALRLPNAMNLPSCFDLNLSKQEAGLG
jgi:hypothetical protein